MKKRLLTIFGVITLLAFSSCGGAAPQQETPQVSELDQKRLEIYRLAVEAGYEGSYQEWLDSIKGQDGEDGINGEDGVSVTSVDKTSSEGLIDTYTITYSDGTTSTFTITNGSKGDQGEQGIQGEPGKDGVSVVSITYLNSVNNVDTYVILFSDNTTTSFAVTNGVDGDQGIQGEKGEDGHTPVITISEDGFWVVDGEKSSTLAQGPKGDQGEQGNPGADGTSVHTGNGAPTSSLGMIGDSYINLENWDFYVKEESGWVLKGNIKGEDGKDYSYDNPQGLDFYITDNGDYYVGQGKATLLSNIVIPSTYKGKPVVGLIDYAFSSCPRLVSITLPNTIEEIGNYCFNYCYNLASVNIPSSVITIAENAFKYTNSNYLKFNCEDSAPKSSWPFNWNQNFPVYYDGVLDAPEGNGFYVVGDRTNWKFEGATQMISTGLDGQYQLKDYELNYGELFGIKGYFDGEIFWLNLGTSEEEFIYNTSESISVDIITSSNHYYVLSTNKTNVDQYLPSGDPSYQVEFEFWHCLGHEKSRYLETIANNFNAKYAGKYHVNLVHPAGDYYSLHEVVKTKIAANEIPTLIMGYPDSFSEYITEDISRSYLLRIDNFIKDANYGFSTAELADFVPGYLAEGNQYQFSGFWSMPMYKSTEVMYYNYSYFMGCNPCNAKKFATNAEFLAKYNKVVGRTLEGNPTLEADLQDLKTWLVEHDGYVYEVPEKWDDAVTLGRQMVSDRYVEGVTAEFYPFGYDDDSNLLISQMAQLGIPYTVNNEYTVDNPIEHIQFNNASAQWLVNDIVRLLDQKILITKNSLGGSIYTNTYFNEGKCAFTVGSTGGSSYNISSNFAVKLAKVPYRGTTPKYIQSGPSICFFNKGNAFVHKGAWLFYKEMSDSVANANFALNNSYDPIRFSSYETDEYRAWISHEGEGLQYDIPAMTAEFRNQNVYMTSPVFIGSSTCRKEIGNIISYIYGSGMDTATAFRWAYDSCVNAVH